MVDNLVFAFLLDKSYDHIINIEEKCLSLFLRKYQGNCSIFKI